MSEEKIVIIDGNSLINRAYYAIQRPMITKNGIYTQGIYGFLSMLQKIRTDYAPTHMLVAFDRKAPTFRHLEYTEYKAGRRKMPLELAMELPLLKEILDAMAIRRFEIDGFEADDIIGTTAKMAEAAGVPAYIITGDRDALQLATDKTSVIITKKGISEFKLYDDAAMMEEYGFDHEQFIDYKALRGDASDNIPGIPGVGEKTATSLIREFGSLDEIIRHSADISNAKLRAKIEDNAMQAVMSKRLATIVTTVPVDFTIEDCRIGAEDTDTLAGIYTRLEFRTYLNRLLKKGAASNAAPAAVSDSIEGTVTQEVVPRESVYYPVAKRITDAETAISLLDSLSGSIVIDLDSDDNHLSPPQLFSLEIKSGDKVYAISSISGLAEITAKALSGKKLGLTGFHLGRLYYLLLAHGADICGLTTEFDAAIAQYVLAPSNSAPSLEMLILEECKETIQNKTSEGQLQLFATDTVFENTGKKLVLLAELGDILGKRIEEQDLGFVYRNIELPLCKVLASMEYEGICLSKEELASFGTELKAEITKLEEQIYDEAGERFNINSTQQLGTILFDKLGLPAGKKTSRGYSTNADVLEKLAQDYPIASYILEYRTLAKLNSTYVEGLIPLIAHDGKVHCHFQQTVTATGRISCTEPNLQNIPIRKELGRRLRRAFTADEGYLLVGADYSQIELRVLAHMSKDPTLIECFREGLDIHRETAAKVFGVPQEEVTPLMRSSAKAVNFGVIYGMSGFGLASGLDISRKQAEKYIQDYFERFPGVRRFMDDCVSQCRQTGEIRTLYGRRRFVPEIRASQYVVRQLGERLAMNTPIQGTAADIIKMAMNRVYEALSKRCPKARLILQIHDELIIQAPESEKDLVFDILQDSMEHAAQLLVSLDVSRSIGHSWYDLK